MTLKPLTVAQVEALGDVLTRARAIIEHCAGSSDARAAELSAELLSALVELDRAHVEATRTKKKAD